MRDKRQLTAWIAEHLSPTEVNLRGVARILAFEVTPYQEMFVVELPNGERALVLDGKWQSSTSDEYIYHESLVHPVLALIGTPARILVIGGAEGATAREALRWGSVTHVTMVDIDEAVVRACAAHLPSMNRGAFDDPRLNVQIADAMTFLERCDATWDAIIVDASDPLPEGPALELFTVEAFERIRCRLSPGGACAIQAGGIAPAVASNFAQVVATMSRVYPQVIPYWAPIATYPGAWGFCIGSTNNSEKTSIDDLEHALAAHVGGLEYLRKGMFGAMQTLPAYIIAAIGATAVVSTIERPITWY